MSDNQVVNGDPLYSAEKAAEFLGLDMLKHPGQAVRALCRKGRLRYVRLGDRIMVRRSWLEEFIEAHSFGPRRPGRKAGA